MKGKTETAAKRARFFNSQGATNKENRANNSYPHGFLC